MTAWSIELGEAIEDHACEHCGRIVHCGRGFVYREQDAIALYWFDQHEENADRRVRLLVALDSGRNRQEFEVGVSFVVEVLARHDDLACALREPDEGPVLPDPEVTGLTLGRREGIAAKELPMLWAVVDAVVEKDPTICAFLFRDG